MHANVVVVLGDHGLQLCVRHNLQDVGFLQILHVLAARSVLDRINPWCRLPLELDAPDVVLLDPLPDGLRMRLPCKTLHIQSRSQYVPLSALATVAYFSAVTMRDCFSFKASFKASSNEG
jgi:hypothetical protein